MQVQHTDVYVSSFENPPEGDYAAPVGNSADHLVPIKGASEVWDAWVVPVEAIADFPCLATCAVSPVEGETTQVSLRVSAQVPDKRVGVRIFVIGR